MVETKRLGRQTPTISVILTLYQKFIIQKMNNPSKAAHNNITPKASAKKL